MNNLLIVFVCHDTESMSKVVEYNYNIILVGDKELTDEYLQYPKLIIARDLQYNIEQEKQLLTFTAWYAIIKNNLFSEYEYICVLEYDVIFLQNFEEILYQEINSNEDTKIFSFMCGSISEFHHNFDFDIANTYLINKGICIDINNTLNDISYWVSTTNHCINRNVISDFVDWYYPSCLDIQKTQNDKIAFYHERMFFIYLIFKQIKTQVINGILNHLFLNSHGYY